MHNSLRYGSALSAIAMATVIAGCAAPQSRARSASIFGGKVDKSNIGLATRALVALNANDFATAINLAERAVENSPRDAGFRAILGNAYFGGGRFASAESAYRDSLALVPDQSQVVLKLALVTIAQGRNAEAISFLASSRDRLDPADYGLALALAGQPREAVNVLEASARSTSADARLRQNLALAHALSGDWTAARTIASQDLSADVVDARIQQWMTFAKPHGAADQVAALTGVKPVAGDPGQPTRLALHSVSTRVAEAAPVAVPQPVVKKQPVAAVAPPLATVAPPPAVAFAPPAPVFAPPAVAFAPPPPSVFAPPAVAFAPMETPAPDFASLALAPQPQPVVQQTFVLQAAEVAAPPAPKPAPVRVAQAPTPAPAPKPQPVSVVIAAAAASAPDAPSAFAAMAAFVQRAQLVKQAAPRAQVRRASMPRLTGNSTSVVQLGAYGTPRRVVAAWSAAARRFAVLRAYSPMSARFNSPKGVVYRLSVRGFGSADQAKNLCMSLRRSGGSCFVRSVAGDVPVRIASR